MLCTDVMDMTTMATACVLSFLEVDGEGEEEEEVVAAVVVAVVVVVEEEEVEVMVDLWEARDETMVLLPDARSTGFLCQVCDVILTLQVVYLLT